MMLACRGATVVLPTFFGNVGLASRRARRGFVQRGLLVVGSGGRGCVGIIGLDFQM
ncbi:hypothetical protein MHPYR_480019 [uncultured Mycobacterium sp.]|uniref:Uncharacterized protein n=1 Tax=uncultured Mycobacterium sp. TaxID=171292 RepID=A0A1Y5PGD7_9MYCO|nr:hypothetical protein MHPYR_480019 [uncultured Mycobacterium sp.]